MSFHCPDLFRITSGRMATRAGSSFGAFEIPLFDGRPKMHVIATDGRNDEGLPVWEHVSCSYRDRTPTWEEMCRIKGLFWDPEDCVLQFHPPESSYVNVHAHCLHLWRPVGFVVPMPPKIFVG